MYTQQRKKYKKLSVLLIEMFSSKFIYVHNSPAFILFFFHLSIVYSLNFYKWNSHFVFKERLRIEEIKNYMEFISIHSNFLCKFYKTLTLTKVLFSFLHYNLKCLQRERMAKDWSHWRWRQRIESRKKDKKLCFLCSLVWTSKRNHIE